MEVDQDNQNGSVGSNNAGVPDRIDIMRLASARIQEIQALTQAIEDPQRTGLVFQKLPRHMRRRAMSRNPKRLPANLREAHTQQMAKSGVQLVNKRPSRKYRRRPLNLLNEYNRRQRTHVWLETHIWHAKRFHMAKKWSYHLAMSPNDRSFRACYRASTSHCLMQDVSFLCCIQLSGEQSELLHGLSKHTSTSCGLTFAARALLSGGREGSLFFYAADSSPKRAVGPVRFLWRPLNADTATTRTLWLWAHPSYYSEIIQHLSQTFGLRSSETGDSAKNILISDISVSLVSLKDSLNRFRLTGPLSHAVLQQSLKVSGSDSKTHNDLWVKLGGAWTPGLLPAGTVLPLLVTDPRLNFPPKRTKAETPRNDEWSNSTNSDEVRPLDSAIWDQEHRESVTKAKLSDAEINARRAKLLVPGSEDAIAASPSIPILVIQRPGNKDESAARIGLGCGWDIVLPSGWAMPFWVSFVFRGGRSSGLREANALAFECGKNNILSPDTNAGRAEEAALEETFKEKHFRLPPDKRPNFRKLNVSSPFRCPWSQLVQDWEGRAVDVNDSFVLRDLSQITVLRQALKNVSSAIGNKDEALTAFNKAEWISDGVGCLVAVRVELIGRGLVADLSSICVPSMEDITAMANDQGVSPEPLQDDEKQEERRNLRSKHEKLLKRLRRQRVREKRQKEDDEDDDDDNNDRTVRRKEPPTKRVVEEHAAKLQELWLPDGTNVKDLASRTTMGFLAKGDFCFGTAAGRGLGYVTLSSLKYLAQMWATCGFSSERLRKLSRKRTSSHLVVLVRSPHSQHYWPAHLHVCVDVRP